MGYKPKAKTLHRKKWGKRKQDEVEKVMTQKCDVFFGMFGEDIEHYLKFGTTLHDELSSTACGSRARGAKDTYRSSPQAPPAPKSRLGYGR